MPVPGGEAAPAVGWPSAQAEHRKAARHRGFEAHPRAEETSERRPPSTLTALELLGLYAAVRVVLLVADVLAAHTSYAGALGGPLRSWDSHFYLEIAAHGYPAAPVHAGGRLVYSPAGFEPVFPVLIRFVALTGLPLTGAAVVVSSVSGAVATLLVWQLGTAVRGDAVGFRAAVLFTLFPGMGVAWGLLYAECVGLALAAGSLLLMVRRRWVWAGVVGAAATATSPLALPLTAAAAAAAVTAIRRRERPSALLAVVLVPTGFVAFALWLGLRYHDLLFWWHLQHQAWGADVDFGKSLVLGLVHLWRPGYQGPGWLEWIGLAVVAGMVLALWRAKLPALVNGYCAGLFLLLLGSNELGFKPRLLTWAIPAVVALAAALGRRSWLVVVVAFAGLLPLVFLVYSTLGNVVAQP